MKFAPIGYVGCFMVCLAATARANVVWTDWTSATYGALGTADGTLATPAGPVLVNYTGEVASPTQVAGGTNYWNPNTPYLSATVPNEPPASDIITLSGGQGIQSVLTFSPPLVNPLMAIVSLGAPGFAVDYDLDHPFSVLSFGPGYWGGPGTLTNLGGNILEGVEGHGVIQFQGTISSVSWTIPASEFWHGFTIGEVPEPTSMVLLAIGTLWILGRGWARHSRD